MIVWKGYAMKTKITLLYAALVLVSGFSNINEAVLPNVVFNEGPGQSLECFSVSGRNGPSPVNVYFVKTVYAAFPKAYSAVHRSRLVVRPVSL